MPMPARHYYRPADLLDFPEDGNKYEVVHGELLVTPAPRMLHQLIVGRLDRLIGAYLEGQSVGICFPGGDVFGGSDSLVIPDLLVVGMSDVRRMDWRAVRSIPLVVEVLSASSHRQDRFTKRRLYQEIRVPLYWLADADAKLVEVWTPEAQFPRVEHERIRWQPEGADVGLEIELGELFREV